MDEQSIEKKVQFPLGFVFEGNLLAASIVDNVTTVRATGQEVEELDFSQNPFNSNNNWE